MPPVSSRTTSRSVPAIRSSRSGLAPTRAGLGPHRAQVGVEAHALAQAEQALLGARRVGVGGVPFGTADGAEQDRVGGAAGLQHLVGEGGAVGVDRAAAHQLLARTRTRPATRAGCRAAATISGPIPSPGRTTMRGASLIAAALYGFGARAALAATASMLRRTYSSRSGSGSASSTAATKGSRSSSGSRSSAGRGRRCARNSAGSRRLDRPRLQPAADLGEAGSAQPRLGLLGAGVVPGLRRSPRSRARRARWRRPRCRSVRRRSMLPAPPHWAASATAGPQRGAQARGRAGRGRAPSGRRRWRRPRRPARPAPARSGRRPAPRPPGRRTSRTFSTIEAEPSTATTRPSGSRSISSPVTRPLPQPASSTVSSPRSGSRSSTDRAHSSCGTETRW